MDSIADRIDALLPQTQCRQCGYAGCRPYAEAIAAGRAGINRCPPGGEDTIRELMLRTGAPFEALEPECGPAAPLAVVLIDEAACIGCALCLAACPVDAIVGAAKRLHTVIASECTGCGLCVSPCPVDCIAMVETGETTTVEQRRQRAAGYRRRHESRTARLERARDEQLKAERERAAERRKRATIERAMQRARLRLQQRRAKPE